MRIFGSVIINVSIILTIMTSFFGLPLGTMLKGLIDTASFICVMGPVLGGFLMAYGSEWGAAFRPRPNREEAEIAVDFYKLAGRISIVAGFMGVMFGLIAMLQAMSAGSSDSWDMSAITGGLALALISTLYGLVYAFCLFLPLQYYFQHQLDKNS